jgi:hypothetical protein
MVTFQFGADKPIYIGDPQKIKGATSPCITDNRDEAMIWDERDTTTKLMHHIWATGYDGLEYLSLDQLRNG